MLFRRIATWKSLITPSSCTPLLNCPPKLSIDLLLASAAHAYGERVIAVILTGTGSDGTAGAQAVKAAGGTVIIENPDTAQLSRYAVLCTPLSVDMSLDLARIGPLLHDLLDRCLRVISAR